MFELKAKRLCKLSRHHYSSKSLVMSQPECIVGTTYASMEEVRLAITFRSQGEGFIFTCKRTRRVGHRSDAQIKAICVKYSCTEILTPKLQQQRKRVRESCVTGCQSAMIMRRQGNWFTGLLRPINSHMIMSVFVNATVHPQGRATGSLSGNKFRITVGRVWLLCVLSRQCAIVMSP